MIISPTFVIIEVVFVNKILKQMNLKGTAREKGINYQMLYRRVKVKKMPLKLKNN